jgi:hypothetical protein
MRPERWPANAPVGNHLGKIETNAAPGISPTNLLPWCWDTGEPLADAEKYAQDHAIGGQPLPRCPPGFRIIDSEENQLTDEEQEAWATRGAINAGMSVFVYIDRLVRGEAKPIANYNECPPTGP